MRFELSSGPTTEPITVADVEAHSNLGTIPSDQVTLVDSLIVAAREYCQVRNKRQLITATWKAYLDDWPAEIVIRDKLPVAGITSIQYVDYNGTTQTWAASNYETDYASPNKPCRIMAADGVVYPTLDSNIYNAITVTFTAGYGGAADVPQTVKNAMLVLVDHWYNNREAVTPATLTEIPMMVDALLAANDWGWYG